MDSLGVSSLKASYPEAEATNGGIYLDMEKAFIIKRQNWFRQKTVVHGAQRSLAW